MNDSNDENSEVRTSHDTHPFSHLRGRMQNIGGVIVRRLGCLRGGSTFFGLQLATDRKLAF